MRNDQRADKLESQKIPNGIAGIAHCHVELMGEHVTLLATRALYWPRGETLFIADPHLGKTDTFQAAGVPIPNGATEDDLRRLSASIHATGARRLVILGDLFHAQAGQSPVTLGLLTTWRREHSGLEVLLVPGNHDRHAGAPPAALGIVCVPEPWLLTPFACYHHPPADASTTYALAGHVHPMVTLRDLDGSRHRFACFHIGARGAVLPAFATFAGGQTIRPTPGDRIFIVARNSIYETSIMSRVV
ncbi:MAG: ligase-associated DNA damage response endonuclease PdeM [Caldilinea sp.]|nr:ligase-associated DNA damage response endonuclease PdeM [Caldilinea sp.]MDW8439258.1 ligase-associated DNA damage response endonuclease PdeM [Caldilineaceae bacterium]